MKYKFLVLSILGLFSVNSWAAPVMFSVTPRVNPPTQLFKGAIGTAIYQVTNNSSQTLSGIGVTNLPAGVSVVANAGTNYCSAPIFNLAAGASCLIKLAINADAVTSSIVSGGPVVCYSAAHPVYCSQPFSAEQLNVQISGSQQPEDCNSNVANFNNELSQNFDLSESDPTWGPFPNVLNMSSSSPNIAQCTSTETISWQQQRIIAAADFWVNQKLNYCHHYVPDWITPSSNRGAGLDDGGYCSPKLDLLPGSPYYNQQVRWNYSSQNSQTANNWLKNNYMWYGMDCSNYTRFLYNFAFGTQFTGDVSWQAGQSADGSQSELSPNQQTVGNVLDNPDAPGKLVCADNTLEVDHSCAGHGGYISAIDREGHRDPSAVTSTMLSNLHPGDLLYIAASLEDGSPASAVTHVVLWTGKTIGDGPDQIPASRIAPDELCPASEWRTAGAWVISDSHYQGADYRAITPCFYLNNLWGVRRVIGASPSL